MNSGITESEFLTEGDELDFGGTRGDCTKKDVDVDENTGVRVVELAVESLLRRGAGAAFTFCFCFR